MNAKYPITELLIKYVSIIQSQRLKYNIEEFSEIFDHVKSWGSNLLKNKMKDIAIEDLWKLFLVDYNYNLFIKKQTKMKELIEEAINSNHLKQTTFETMFGKKVPFEILKGEACKVPNEFINIGHKEQCKDLFSEDKFLEIDRYICIEFENRYKLGKKQTEYIEDFIVKTIEELMKPLSDYGLRNEYWMFAMYLMNKNVSISNPLWERIKYICFDDEYVRQNTEFKWRHVFSVLNENCSLKNQGYYSTPNVLYYDNPKEPMSDENLPSFNIRYDIEAMRTTGNEEDDYFELKLEDGVSGKIKLIDLFMIFYRGNYVMSKKKDNVELFKKTCIELVSYNIKVPFLKLNLFYVPDVGNKLLDIEFLKLMRAINNFYIDENNYDPKTDTYAIKEKYQNNQSLIFFKKNINACIERFIDVIAIDFSFIKKLPSSKDEKLRKELEEVVDNFRDNNLR